MANFSYNWVEVLESDKQPEVIWVRDTEHNSDEKMGRKKKQMKKGD